MTSVSDELDDFDENENDILDDMDDEWDYDNDEVDEEAWDKYD